MIPSRNVNWSSSGKWVQLAKVGFEKYLPHKGASEPFHKTLALRTQGIEQLKVVTRG